MGAKSGRLWLYCFCSYSVFPKLAEPTCWTWALPTMPVNVLETQNVEAALLVGHGSSSGSVAGRCSALANPQLTKLICLKSLWTLKESLSHCSVLLICLVLHGLSALGVFCFIACLQKRLRGKEQSKPFLHFRFSPGCVELLGWMFKS